MYLFFVFVCMVVCWLVCWPASLMVVCWLVCAGEVLEYASFSILFSVSAAWLDWLACDCVQLFVSFLFLPRRVWGRQWFFLCSNFLDASMSLLFVWFVVVCFLLGLGFSRPWFWDVVVLKFYFLWRVWSWLRTNAGGVLNTCKSNGKALLAGYSSGERVSNTWVICPALRDKPGKLGLIPDRSHF